MSSVEIERDVSYRRGLAAVALFVVMAAVFFNSTLQQAAGFGANAEVTRSIGAALFNLDPSAVTSGGDAAIAAEGFLVALILMAVLLDAALDGALMLAKREEPRGGGKE